MDSRGDSNGADRIMKLSGKMMPVAAAAAALSTLACCLPLSFSAAAGIATLGVVLKPYRTALIVTSIVFFAIGVFHLYRFRRSCRNDSVSDAVIMVLSGIVVLGVSLFPQVIAVVLADLFP